MDKLIAALAALTAGIETAASVYSQVHNTQLQLRKTQLLGAQPVPKARVGFVRDTTVC